MHDVLLVEGAKLPEPTDDPVAWIRSIEKTDVDVKKREIVAPIPLPTIGEREKEVLLYPITSTVVVSVEHWGAHPLAQPDRVRHPLGGADPPKAAVGDSGAASRRFL